MLASNTGRPGCTASLHSNPAFAARRHARSRASMPNGRAGFGPTGINRIGVSFGMSLRINARNPAGKWPNGLRLARTGHFAHLSRRMADLDQKEADRPHGSIYRVAGPLTITRAATTQREIDAMPDPLTIDLSEIDR